MAKQKQIDAPADVIVEKPKPHRNLPVVEVKAEPVKETSNGPADDHFTGGIFRDRASGEEYALAIHPPDDYFRTHSLKNTAHFCQMTEEEFRQRFDRA